MVLDLLRTYFLFKDCVEEGEKLIDEAGPDPLSTIKQLRKSTAESTTERWKDILKRQGLRLYSLQGYITGQNYLAVLSPDIQSKITEIVGYKLTRANSLHGIGATLFFLSVFPIADSDEKIASYVTAMVGSESDLLDMEAIRNEIGELRKSLEEYRKVVLRLVSDYEVVKLADQARRDTLFQNSPTTDSDSDCAVR